MEVIAVDLMSIQPIAINANVSLEIILNCVIAPIQIFGLVAQVKIHVKLMKGIVTLTTIVWAIFFVVLIIAQMIFLQVLIVVKMELLQQSLWQHVHQSLHQPLEMAFVMIRTTWLNATLMEEIAVDLMSIQPFALNANVSLEIKVINFRSETFGNQIFQKVLQN
jgi:hypothetical protein